MLSQREPQQFDRPAARRLLQGLQGTAVLGPAYAPSSLPSSDGSPMPPTQSQFQQDSSPKFSLTVNHFNPSIVTVMVILLFAFFFMGFLSLYVVRCRRRSTGLSLRRAAETLVEGSSQGLDPYILRGVPLIAYSSAKKKGNNVECVVCLMEFEEQEPLRQLPGCKHVFHPDCIDMWLYSHSTCPLCRRKIGVPSGGGLSFRWGSGSFRHLPFLSRGGSGVPNNEPPAGSEEAARTPLVESGTRLHIQTSRSAGVDIYRSASAEISNLTGFDRRPWETGSNAVNEATASMNREGHGQASAGTNGNGLPLARANSTGHSLAKCGSS